MLNLIFCEILKLKHSKILFLECFLGVLATPMLMFVESLQTHFEHPEKIFTLADIYDSSLLYNALTNFIIYISISAYLFSREYSEQTLKTILPVPVSRFDFISAKFLVLFLDYLTYTCDLDGYFHLVLYISSVNWS